MWNALASKRLITLCKDMLVFPYLEMIAFPDHPTICFNVCFFFWEHDHTPLLTKHACAFPKDPYLNNMIPTLIGLKTYHRPDKVKWPKWRIYNTKPNMCILIFKAFFTLVKHASNAFEVCVFRTVQMVCQEQVLDWCGITSGIMEVCVGRPRVHTTLDHCLIFSILMYFRNQNAEHLSTTTI